MTKDDAREAQHAEATIYGGQNPRGGMAAQMQVGTAGHSGVADGVTKPLQSPYIPVQTKANF